MSEEMRGRELELELSTVGRSELVRERECGLIVVGPLKTVQPSSIGQTGRPYRSDRSGPG